MARFIDSDKLICQVQNNDKYGTITKQMFISLLQNSETEDVAPVVHAHWIETEDLICRLLMAVLSNIVHEECCCYSCPLCKLTGIDKACEHPDEVIAFALDSDPLVIESIVSEVKRNAKP